MTIKDAKEVLRQSGYYVDNLWHIDDVQRYGDISDDDAYQVLDSVLQNGYTIENINELFEEEFYQQTN